MTDRIISADDHIDLCYLPADLWEKRLPTRWREQAPRVIDSPEGKIWFKEGKRWGVWGSKRPENRIVVYDKAGLPEEPEPGIWRCTSSKYRLEDLDREGIHASVMYNFLDWAFVDQELKAACCTAFNSWLAEELCAAAPGRLIGLATLPGHDPAAAVRELRRAKEIGLGGGFFEVFSAAIPIFDEAWDPLWCEAETLGMSINVHTGAGGHTFAKIPSKKAWRFPTIAALGGIQLDEILTTAIYSGMLDRHPGLKFVLGEAGIGWIPFVLERLEYERDNFRDVAGGVPIKAEPREIFHRQVYATFQDEKLGVRLIPEIGIGNVMWAADYPHGDGTFPHSQAVIARMFGDADPVLRRKVLWGNAAAVYGIT